MSTRGCRFLDQRGISYEVHPYEHRTKGAAYAAEKTGIPLERMIKTLVTTDPSGSRFWFVLMPGTRDLNLKSAARALGLKKMRMANASEAERVTGYQVGGISPFGSRQSLPVMIEESLTSHSVIAINGGARGCILSLKTADLIRILSPVIAPLS